MTFMFGVNGCSVLLIVDEFVAQFEFHRSADIGLDGMNELLRRNDSRTTTTNDCDEGRVNEVKRKAINLLQYGAFDIPQFECHVIITRHIAFENGARTC